jgi:hypothetical protein
MKITINETSDWKKLVADGLGTVVDPLVFRCGELFLKGANDADGEYVKIGNRIKTVWNAG